MLGDGECLGIWNPDNKLRSYKSFKEALVYLAIAEETALFPEVKFRVVRSASEYDFKNVAPVDAREEKEYYALQ